MPVPSSINGVFDAADGLVDIGGSVGVVISQLNKRKLKKIVGPCQRM